MPPGRDATPGKVHMEANPDAIYWDSLPSVPGGQAILSRGAHGEAALRYKPRRGGTGARVRAKQSYGPPYRPWIPG